MRMKRKQIMLGGCCTRCMLYYISKMYLCQWECLGVSGSVWECLRVVGPESQGGQIPELTAPMLWPSGARESTWERGQRDVERRRQAWERWQQACEHLESLSSSLAETACSVGTLLVHLEIIATTYRSTIFKTHVFSLYSHLSIYVSI